MAQPGSVVISAATHQHVAGFFETRDLGEMPVKGVPRCAPSRCCGRGVAARALTWRWSAGSRPWLVGSGNWPRCVSGSVRSRPDGGRVGIAGEAGIGKSRLVLEFRRALAQAGEAVTWLEGHCISFGQASPFLPLIELLRENFQIDELDGEPEIIAKVEQGMRRMGELEAPSPPSATCSRSTRATRPRRDGGHGAAAAPLRRLTGVVTPWRTAASPGAGGRRPALDRHQQ